MADGKSASDAERAWRKKWGWIGLGVVAVIVVETCVYAGGAVSKPWWSACGGLLACAAPFAFGALVGFLFGIPRTLQSDAPAQPPPPGQAADGNSGAATSYRVNTNLEQISDWLTKILVGVGLTQFKEIPPRIWSMAAKISCVFGSGGCAQGIAAAVLVTFLIAGFFVGYLATRLILAPAFRDADPGPAFRSLNNAAVDFSTASKLNQPVITGARADDVQRVLKYRLDELTTVPDITAWAKAQLAQKRYSDAAAAYSKAISMDPNNSQLMQEHAAALAAMQDYSRAQSELQRAASIASTPAERQRVIEGLVLTSLYDDPPQGFESAIRYGEQYLADPGAKPSAAIEAWLGAAYGQKHKWLSQQKPTSPSELDAARSAALDHIRKALRLDPEWKRVLSGLLKPAQEGGDDDLESFRDDPEFKRLLS